MLIFRRKPGEKVILGRGQITVKVIGVDRGDVVIGFQAADEIAINRDEVYRRKMRSGNRLQYTNFEEACYENG